MTGILTRPSAPAPPPRGTGRSVGLLVAAGALVVLVVGAVLLFAVDRPPDLETLADGPDPAPSASVAWTSWGDQEACIVVARPSGRTEEVWCDRQGGDLVAWPEPDRIEVLVYEGRETLRTIDVESGEVVERTAVTGDQHPGLERDTHVVYGEHRDGELTVYADDDTELWRVEAPERYEITTSAMSADGDWVAMVDSASRLLVVPADGSAPPRVWVTDAPMWDELVWEGVARR